MTPTLPLRLETLGRLLLIGPAGSIILRRRIDLALLTVVADRAPALVKREELQTLFWGDRSEDKARHSLRQVVMRLRQACGDAIEVRDAGIRLATGAIDVDVQRFTAAARDGRWRDATRCWTGAFLPECEDIGIDSFRTWLEVERERLRLLLADCHERSAREVVDSGDHAEMLRTAEAWVRDFPLDEGAQLFHIRVLAGAGRTAEASAARATFISRFRAALDESPGTEWLVSSERVLKEAHASDEELVVSSRISSGIAPFPPPSIEAVQLPAAAPSARSLWQRHGWAVAIGACFVAGAAAVSLSRSASARSELPPLAVGEITSTIARDSVRGFAMLLTIDLARIAELNVISERRLSEVGSAQRIEGIEATARAAGAREIIDGVLSRTASGMLRADLRRTDLTTGATRAVYTVEAGELTTLADLVTERVARELDVPFSVPRREAVTGSIVGYRLYEQGLRAYNDGDAAAARRFFSSALAEDSTFAMAAFYKARVVEGDSADHYFARAKRLSEHTSDRERLLISATWGRLMTDPRVRAWAETLLTRYPSESEAHLMYAREMLAQNNPSASLAHFRMVVAMDSTTRGLSPSCRACEGLVGMMESYSLLDSAAAEEKAAHQLIRWQPHGVTSWTRLAGVRGNRGRYAEAHTAIDSATKYSADMTTPFEHTIWWFRTNDFANIDRLWRELARSTKPPVRMHALWTGTLSLRTQGRSREALAVAQEYRRDKLARAAGPQYDLSGALPEALALQEAGEPRRAAALFDSIVRVPQAPYPSRLGAHRAMNLVHVASALREAGDTSRLRSLEDSVRVNGRLASPRYHGLHNYVRGLRLAAGGRHADAASALRDALWGPRHAYVRIYLELGRALLADNRPAEAIGPLVIALEGPTSASGLYATRTELQELLGLAYERAGKPDSALVQYEKVVFAWRAADAPYARRRAEVLRRIQALRRRDG